MASKVKLVSVGKQLHRHVTTSPAPSASLLLRRTVHVSVYDKNVEDNNVRPDLVPDEVIEAQSEKYWSPHPKTGVFGPDTDQATAAGERELSASEESVLEQKSFFRPQEDLDKPAHN